ncbi:helix-turn-helix family protein [Candidatus Endolissoclinum faulkneri L2]|uniref:Helix-turn-helix family protein n=1 Tax=Candidatus Endolissoclinum faulkneri L2 TaxID=1193729 RepID=K7ZDG7_9PROT|nr:helix-turn-helix transcriptional regulator [Candidatus Endolissoclinum faulkneri]AFX99506.1 helix-turn-helix family protein [Candidatus Endolissoclinum faulkneri L2]
MTKVESYKYYGDNNYQITNNNPIDIHVGRRVRLRRTLLGMSQEKLGEALNITFQQVQKYESGSSRISSSRLWDIAQILDIPVSFFFDDISDDTIAHSPHLMKTRLAYNKHEENTTDLMFRHETLELVSAYYSIKNSDLRKHISEMVKSVAVALLEES